MEEVDGREVEPFERAPHEARAEEPGHSAHEGPDQVVGGDGPDLYLEGNDGEGGQEAEQRSGPRPAGKRRIEIAGLGQEHDHDGAKEDEPHGWNLTGPRDATGPG